MSEDEESFAIHSAAELGNVEKLEELLQNVPPNLQNRSGETALHVVCKARNSFVETEDKLKIIKLLWENGARMNAKGGQRKETSLHLAVKSQQVEIVRFLLEHGAIVNSYDRDNVTPLHVSACTIDNSDIDVNRSIVKLLLEHGANFHAQDSRWKTPLIKAVCCGNAKFIEQILEAGAQIDYPNRVGLTALFYACEIQNEGMVKLLLQHHASVNIRDQRKKSTPLHFLAASGRFQIPQKINQSNLIARLLIEHGIDIDAIDSDGMTALNLTAHTKDDKLMEVLLKAGAKVDIADNMRMTALHTLLWDSVSCETDKLERMVKLLLDYNAQILQENDNHETPYHYALSLGNRNILIEFLKNSETITNLIYIPEESSISRQQNPLCNTPELCGEYPPEYSTPLSVAACFGYLDIIDLILDLHVGIDIPNFTPGHDVIKTPLYFAVKNGHFKCAHLLLEAGCTINRSVLHKTSVLHVAVSQMQTALVHLLLQYGADSQVKDFYQRTPLLCAVEYERSSMEKIVEILVMYLTTRTSQNLNVNEDDTRAIESRQKLRTFQSDCKEELWLMKKDILCDNVTMYSLLCKNLDSLALCLMNDSVLDSFVNKDLQKVYPIYSDVLKLHFDLGLERKKLIECAIESLNNLFQNRLETLGYKILPDVIIRKILSFFYPRHLRKITMLIHNG